MPKPKITGMNEDEQAGALRSTLQRFERLALDAWASGSEEDQKEMESRAERIRSQLDDMGIPHQLPAEEVRENPEPPPTSRPQEDESAS